MDPVLAEMFGTLDTGPTEEELDKTASLELLQKIAEAYDIDVSQLSDEQIIEAMSELEGVTKVASDDEQMFANSKYAGQVMAHSFVAELRGIQKVAEYSMGNPLVNAIRKEAKVSLKDVGAAVKDLPGRLANVVGRRAGQKKLRQAGVSTALEGNSPVWREAGKEIIKRRAKQVGVGAGAAAALGTAAYGGKKLSDMNKKSFDEAVYERAAEHLAAAGLMTDDGDLLAPEYAEKTAHDVDAAALGLLEEMGYPVEWY
jgi:hypothetical protein